MTEHMNNLPDPEEFWPDAEKMLNGHFKAKRRRRAAILLSALLISLSAVLFFSQNNDQPVSAEHSSPAQQPLSADVPATQTVIREPAAELPEHTQPAGVSAPEEATHQVMDKAPVPLAPEKSETAVQHTVSKTASGNLPAVKNSTPARVEPVVAVNTPSPVQTSAPPAAAALQTEHLSLSMNAETSSGSPDELSLPAILEPLHFLTASAIRIENTEDPSVSGKQEVKAAPKQKSKLSLIAYGGLSYVDKVINSPGNTIYMQRREQEESATFLPYGGLQIARSTSRLEVRLGAEFSVLGEKVKYSPYKNGTYYNSYIDWDPYTYTVTDTDSAWIFGMLFLQTSSQTINDSIQVTKTDTLNGMHYDASILSANGTNRWYLVQFPIELTYPVIRGRFGIGISGGIAPGFILSSEGKYLLKDESGVREINRDARGTFMLNAGGGIEFSYLFGERFSILLRPTVRYFLTPVEEENGASKNYRTYGLHAGLRYSIR